MNFSQGFLYISSFFSVHQKEQRSDEGPGVARSALFCVLMSPKRRVRVGRPEPTNHVDSYHYRLVSDLITVFVSVIQVSRKHPREMYYIFRKQHLVDVIINHDS